MYSLLPALPRSMMRVACTYARAEPCGALLAAALSGEPLRNAARMLSRSAFASKITGTVFATGCVGARFTSPADWRGPYRRRCLQWVTVH